MELAAYHYREAIAYGEDDALPSRRASEHMAAGGWHSTERVRRGPTQLDRAAELATDDDTRAAAELVRGRLEATVGGPDAALHHLDLALSLAKPDDVSLRAEALSWRSRALWLSGRWDEALASATASVETLAGQPDSPQRAQALARRAQLAMLRVSRRRCNSARRHWPSPSGSGTRSAWSTAGSTSPRRSR